MSTQHDPTLSPPTRRLVGPAEMARILGRSESAIRKWADAGLIPHHRVASARMFDPDEVLEATRVEIVTD